jgi:hypothetical protein
MKQPVNTDTETLLMDCVWLCFLTFLPVRACLWISPLPCRHVGKFQNTERFLIPCPRHVSSRLPSSGGTCMYATAASTQKKKLEEILYILICSFLLCLSWLLRSRVRNFRRHLWIILYVFANFLWFDQKQSVADCKQNEGPIIDSSM